jgi:DNA-binding transcriptional LysR family regulator
MAGRAFLEEAKIATTASRRAVTAVRAADGELAGELFMAVHMGLGARQLPHVLGQRRARHPQLQVTLYEEPDPAELERLLRQGTLDMFLVHRLPAGCAFDVHTLGEEACVAVLPKGHPLLAGGGALRLEDLACPLRPSPTEPVLVGGRRGPGPAEAAMLDHLGRQNWCGTALLGRSATD